MIKSPFTDSPATLVKTIPTATIAALYTPIYDVKRFFEGLSEVQVYECPDTHYRFYEPATVAGDGPFYEALSKEATYYLPWKYEHAIADSYIKPSDTVRELGCATGDFLVDTMRRKQIKPFGTELNEEARATAEARGVSFAPTTTADVTCAFEVLEHISDVRGFMEDAIASTKPGGYVIFGIPNNQSIMAEDPRCFLNMPPHHMGLWTEESLRAVAPHLGLAVEDVRTEVLQPQHYRYYYQVKFGDRFRRFGFLGKLFNKITYELIAHPLISLFASRILGLTLVVIYKKPA